MKLNELENIIEAQMKSFYKKIVHISCDEYCVWITPSANTMSYPEPEKEFEIFEEDFVKTMMDYEMFKRGINVKEFNEKLIQKVLYGSEAHSDDNGTTIFTRGDRNGQD